MQRASGEGKRKTEGRGLGARFRRRAKGNFARLVRGEDGLAIGGRESGRADDGGSKSGTGGKADSARPGIPRYYGAAATSDFNRFAPHSLA